MAGNRSNRTLLALALAGVTTLPVTPAAAQSKASVLHAGTLEIPLNKSQVVTADRPIAKAMIGGSADPKDQIADVVPLTDRSIYVLGKKMGTTSLTLYDSGGRVLSIMDIAVGPDVIALDEQLRQLVPGEKIDAHISNESLVLTGVVSSPGAADRAMQLARTFAGEKVVNLMAMGSSQQVMLEVRFAEVSRNTGKEIGVKFGAQSNDGTFSGITGTGSGFQPGIPGTVETTVDSAGNVTGSKISGAILPFLSSIPIADSFSVLRKSFGLGGLNITAMLNALETRGLAKTLAQPTLVALSGEKASFLVGGEFPVPVNQTNGSSGAITVEFKPFGISLAFTPTVLGDRTISMIVNPEVSAIDNNASLRIGNLVIPGLRTRRASTTLELRDGESFALAGLISRDFETTVEQVPILGSIPILGALFRSSGFKKGETELLIVVTPHLVQPLKPGQVRLPTDRVLDPREGDTFLLGQSYRPTKVEPAVPPAAGAPAATDAQPAKKEDGYAF
ncbi:MAG: type II and III secretion system protein family protein [Novosphingobium sp.]